MQIIPAIYVLNGHCVALYKGSYEQKATYFKSPVEMAHHFQKEGAKRLHLVDLNGRHAQSFEQKEVVERVVKSVQIPVQLEAGFSTMAQIEEAFKLGVEKVALRPFALPLIKEALEKYGPEKIIVEIEAKGSGTVGAGEASPGEPVDVVDFAEKLIPIGIKEVIYKDDRSEGTLIHPNYDEVDRLFLITGESLKIYVSGGISDVKHVQLLKKIGASGAIIGKAFYERMLSLKEAQRAGE